jgi:hypothetical protein
MSDRGTLVNLYAPIYARHLSEADARGVISFHHTPLGRRLRAAMPRIREECQAASQEAAGTIAAQLLGADEFATDLAPAPDTPDARDAPASDTPDTPNARDTPAPDMRDAPNASDAPAVPKRRAQAIAKLLQVSGALAQARQAMLNMIEQFERASPAGELPAAFWNGARQRLTDEADLIRLWTPAYARHLDDHDIRGLIDFYRSPVGQRYVLALPAIHQESVEATTQLANTAARRAIREVLGPLPQWKLQRPDPAPPAPEAPR